MRIVLRNIKTGLYLHETGKWTRNLTEARTFKHGAEAMDLARNYRLEGLEVLLDFEEPPAHQRVSIPLPLSAATYPPNK